MVAIKKTFNKRIFNPAEEPKDLLIATFAIRQELFKKLMTYVESGIKSSAPQHSLIIGQRGMGKTTLMLRIKYEIEDNEKLNKYIIPIKLSEEQYNISSLPDLWEELGKQLESYDSIYQGLVDKILSKENHDDFEREMFKELITPIKNEKKRILVLIDNIGDLFNKLTDLESKRFREILMTSPHIQIIGASTHMLEETFRYDKPFFEFFYERKLEPITKKEAQDLMMALAKNYDAIDEINTIIEKYPERIEVLRRLSGGVPRTMILLFEIFLDEDRGSVFEYLEILVDRVGDLYKTRMDHLKPQQQKIIDALAKAWEPITAGEILEKSKLKREGLASNQISAQLKQLEQNQFIESVGDKRKSYFIRERFFNIWYLMRHGRSHSKEKVLWLVKFLESWCTKEELDSIVKKHFYNLDSENYSVRAAYYKTIALEGFVDEMTRYDMYEKLIIKLEKSNLINSKEIEKMKVEKKILSNKIIEFYVKKWTHKFPYQLFENIGDAQSINSLGNIFMDLDHYKLAEKLYKIAIDKGYKDALLKLALLYHNYLKDLPLADYYYNLALNNNVKDSNYLYALFLISEKEDIENGIMKIKSLVLEGNVAATYFIASILLQSNSIDQSLIYFKILYNNLEFFNNTLFKEKRIDSIVSLIIKYQTHFLLKHFQDENSLLNKYMRPMYYVLAYFMKDELPGEYEKTTPEIKETVDEIINTILQEKKKLAESDQVS